MEVEINVQVALCIQLVKRSVRIPTKEHRIFLIHRPYQLLFVLLLVYGRDFIPAQCRIGYLLLPDRTSGVSFEPLPRFRVSDWRLRRRNGDALGLNLYQQFVLGEGGEDRSADLAPRPAKGITARGLETPGVGC